MNKTPKIRAYDFTIPAGKSYNIEGLNVNYILLTEANGALKLSLNGGVAIPFPENLKSKMPEGVTINEVEIINVQGAEVSGVVYLGDGDIEIAGQAITGTVKVANEAGGALEVIGANGTRLDVQNSDNTYEFGGRLAVSLGNGTFYEQLTSNAIREASGTMYNYMAKCRLENASHVSASNIGTTAVMLIDPSVNTSGLLIRRMHIATSSAQGVNVFADTGAPASYDDTTKKSIGMALGGVANFADPIILASGEGLYAIASGGSSTFHIVHAHYEIL